MKRIYLYTIVLITIHSCTDSGKKSVFASIGYNKDTLTIGQISKGDTAHVGFGFVSTGDVPLKILKVNASCGCAVPHYDSTKEYKKGETGVVDIYYNSKDDSGSVLKTLVVRTNTEKQLKVLYLKATVN